MAIRTVHGNLFHENWQSAVITINCIGAMGAGIALAAAKINSDMEKWYKSLCKQKKIHIGEVYYYTQDNEKTFILLPTKNEWYYPSTLEYVERGLQALVATYQYNHVDNIYIPPLGCSNGKLKWRDVKPLMYQYLEQIQVPVTIVL